MKHIILLIVTMLAGCQSATQSDNLNKSMSPDGPKQIITYDYADLKKDRPDGILSLDTIQNAVHISVNSEVMYVYGHESESLVFEYIPELDALKIDYDKSSDYIIAVVLTVTRVGVDFNR